MLETNAWDISQEICQKKKRKLVKLKSLDLEKFFIAIKIY